ncbi:MAG: hypothetical protein KM310_01245 [Clostridiales bacterium]|nr:hypothetical protein [Clostridiales bacterium]
MRPIPEGYAEEVVFTVIPGMEAAFEGRVVHPVLATWWLVHYAEWASRKVLLPHLEEGEEGAGIGVNLRHRGAAPLGSQVRVKARAVKVDGRTLVCAVEAYVGDRLIATGEVYQAVWPEAELRRALSQVAPEKVE